MVRKKVNLQYIPNNSTRRSTFQKRSQGLMKKAGELSTLCGVKASVVIYGEGESVPQVFPSHSEAVENLNRFRDMPELKQYKKIMDQESFLLQRIDKLQNQVNKSMRDYHERETKFLVHKVMSGKQDLAVLSTDELTYVASTVDVLLKRISDRITKITGNPPVYHPPATQAPTPNVIDGMNIIGTTKIYPVAPFQQHEGLLDMVSSGGGDLDDLVYNRFNSGWNGATSTYGFQGGEIIPPLDLGDGSGCPWAEAHPGPSSSYFPPM